MELYTYKPTYFMLLLILTNNIPELQKKKHREDIQLLRKITIACR